MSHVRSKNLGRYCAAFVLALCACSTSHDEPLGAEQAAVGTSDLQNVENLVVRQRLSLSSIGNTPVRLTNGQWVDVTRAANAALGQHRQLANEAAAARSALFTDAETTEELIETAHTVMLVATTHLVVVDPGALARLSPILGEFHFKGPNAMRLADLDTQQRAFFDDLKARMLKKPKNHPLGAAARRGDAALLAAALSGQGELTITTTVERPIGGLSTNGNTYMAPAVVDGSFDYQTLHQQIIPGFGSLAETFSDEAAILGDRSSKSGTATTDSAFINGFTEGSAVGWNQRWDFGIGYVKIDAGASYGFGARIPIGVTGTMTPTFIGHAGDQPDEESRFDSSVKVDVLDADLDFYRKAGIREEDLHEAKEFVANAEAHVTLKVSLLGAANVNLTLPKGFEADLGQHFRPPFNGCGTECGLDFWVPAWVTKTQINLAIAGADAQLGFKLAGDGQVDLDYETTYDREVVNSSSGSGSGEKTHRLSFTDDDERSFHTTLAPLSEPGHKPFGYQVSNLSYTWQTELIPGVQGRVWVDCVVLDWNHRIGPFWFEDVAIGLGDVSFGPHDGSRDSQAVNKGTKSWSEIAVEQTGDVNQGPAPGNQPPFDDGEGAGGGPSFETTHDGDLPANGHPPEFGDVGSSGPLDEMHP